MSKKKKIIIAVCVLLVFGTIGNIMDGDSSNQEQAQETVAMEENESQNEGKEDSEKEDNEIKDEEEGEKEDIGSEEKELTKEEREQQEKERRAELREQEKKEIKDIVDGFTKIFADEPDEEDIDKLKDYNQKLVFREFNRQIKQLSAIETGNITKLSTAFGMVFTDCKNQADEIIAMAEAYDEIDRSIDFSNKDIKKKQNQVDSLKKDIEEAIYMDVYIYEEIDMGILGKVADWTGGETVYYFETVDGMEGALYTDEKFPEAGYYSIGCLNMGETLSIEDNLGFGGDIPKYKYLPDSTGDELEQAQAELEEMKANISSRDSAEKELRKRLKKGFTLE